MVRDCALQPKPAEPYARLRWTSSQSAEAIADQQHSNHKLGINGWPADAAVEACKLACEIIKLDEPLYRAKQMIRRNVPSSENS